MPCSEAMRVCGVCMDAWALSHSAETSKKNSFVRLHKENSWRSHVWRTRTSQFSREISKIAVEWPHALDKIGMRETDSRVRSGAREEKNSSATRKNGARILILRAKVHFSDRYWWRIERVFIHLARTFFLFSVNCHIIVSSWSAHWLRAVWRDSYHR